jgi:hypothetical protein
VADSQLEQRQDLEHAADAARQQHELPGGSRVSEGRLRVRWRLVGFLLAAGLALAAAGSYAWWRLAERSIQLQPRANLPEILLNQDGILILAPTGVPGSQYRPLSR